MSICLFYFSFLFLHLVVRDIRKINSAFCIVYRQTQKCSKTHTSIPVTSTTRHTHRHTPGSATEEETSCLWCLPHNKTSGVCSKGSHPALVRTHSTENSSKRLTWPKAVKSIGYRRRKYVQNHSIPGDRCTSGELSWCEVSALHGCAEA